MHGTTSGVTRVRDQDGDELKITQDGQAQVVNDDIRRLLESLVQMQQAMLTLWGGQHLIGDLEVDKSGQPRESTQMDLGRVWINGRVFPVKWAEINATASGDTTVVQATAGKIRVIGLDIVVSASVDIAWKSGANTIRNAQAFASNGGMVVPTTPGFFVETAAGEALVINLSTTANARGCVRYVEV